MELSDKVVRVLATEHISVEELSRMLSRAAITSIRACNRRFHHWVFRVVGDTLQDMQYADPILVGRGRNRMFEDHFPCDGRGCRDCGWVGQISRSIEDVTAQALTQEWAHPVHRW